MSYLFLGLSLIILVKSADVLVGAASKLAKRYNIPAFLIGLFIISIGTSAPEAAIGILSGIKGTNLITFGDVVGSSIVNILVVIGITAMIFPLKVDSSVPRREMIISILVQMIFIVMVYTFNILSRIESIVLLIGTFLFFIYVYKKSRGGVKPKDSEIDSKNEIYEYIEVQEEIIYEKDMPSEKVSNSLLKLIILIIVGLAGLVGSANLAVTSAVEIAHNLGLSEVIIGLTIVAVGTSLPELVTCLIAVFKKEEDIAVGNIVGSNIFNILFVMGISGMIHPIEIGSDVYLDMFIMLFASILLFIPAYFFGKISKISGFIYFAAYIIYLSYKITNLG